MTGAHYALTVGTLLVGFAGAMASFDGLETGVPVEFLMRLHQLLSFPFFPALSLLRLEGMGNGLSGHVWLVGNSLVWALALYFGIGSLKSRGRGD